MENGSTLNAIQAGVAEFRLIGPMRMSSLPATARSLRTTNLEQVLEVGSEENIDQLAVNEPTAEDRLIGAAERDYVLRALGELPPALREVLVLREIEELSYRDIAEVTGAPIGTVMSRLSRGRGELRKVLARLIEKDEPDAV